jgi:hypothetical protein
LKILEIATEDMAIVEMLPKLQHVSDWLYALVGILPDSSIEVTKSIARIFNNIGRMPVFKEALREREALKVLLELTGEILLINLARIIDHCIIGAGKTEIMEDVVEALHTLCEDNEKNRQIIATSGVPSLLILLSSSGYSTKTIESLAGILDNLTLNSAK